MKKDVSELNDVITVDDICVVLGIGRNTAYQLLKSGEIPSRRIKRKYIIPRKALIFYVENVCSDKI